MFILSLTMHANSFDLRVAHAVDESINDILEYPNFYILSGKLKINGVFNTYIIKVDKQGNVLKDTALLPGSYAANILKISNSMFVAICADLSNYPYKTKLEYVLFDTSISHIYTKNLYLPDSLYAMRYYASISNDSTILISGTLNKYSLSIPVNMDPFVYKASITGDSLAFSLKSNCSSNIDRGFNTIELEGKYYIFMSYWTNSTDGSILVMDKNLITIDTIDIPNSLYDSYSALLMKDSTILVATLSQNNNSVYISNIDSNGNLGVSKVLGNAFEYPYPAYQNTLSRNKNYIFAVRNIDFPLSSPFYGIGNSSNLVVSKMDNNLNTVWEWDYGGDAFYHAYNILATADMGCIIIGNVNDTINHNYNRDIFIIKLDSNGTTTWVRNIQPPRVAISLYPNPAGHTLNISLEAPNQDITACRIYDLHGRLLQQEHGHGRKLRINVQTLPAGAYVVEGETTGGKVFRAKFLKE
jgi:hypothetical protein